MGFLMVHLHMRQASTQLTTASLHNTDAHSLPEGQSPPSVGKQTLKRKSRVTSQSDQLEPQGMGATAGKLVLVWKWGPGG